MVAPAHPIPRLLKRWFQDNRGSAIIIFALASPVIVGGAALAVETSFDYIAQNHLQSAADSAAYAGGIESMGGSNLTTITAAASQQATSNGWVSANGTLTVNNPPTTGAFVGKANAVEVRLTMNVPRYFTAVFISTPVQLTARAVALTQTAGNACVLALDKTASAAVNVTGNSNMTLTACQVMSNSVANDAVKVWGSAQLSADCVLSSGGVTNNGGMHLTGCPSAITNAPRDADPFAGLATPATGPTRNMPNGNGNGHNSVTTLDPGNYRSGMDLSGNVVLNPGTYYVQGGDFHVNANANISGSGVTIYLASGSQVSMNGNAVVTLSAPTSGTYSGILFFGDRAATSGANTFNGDASSQLTGDLYFPTQSVSYLGNFSGANGCTHIIADTVTWSGSTTFGVDCSAAGMTPIPSRLAIKIVE